MKKKVLLILGVIIFICGIGITCYRVTSQIQNRRIILDGKLTTNDYDKTSFVQIYNTGKVENANLKNKKFVDAIIVNPNIFINHTNEKNNSLYNTINTKLLYHNKQLTSKPAYIKIIKYISKHSNHMIAILNIFDIDGEYYAFLKYNAGISDEGTLYKYNNNKLNKICTLDSGQIIGLKKAKR